MEPACAVLEISPSTYYAAKKREENPSARDERDEELKREIMRVREKKGRKLYGAKKMWRELNRDGIEVARCTVERLMREMGLEGLRARKKRPRTTVPGPAGQERPSDLLERDFTAEAPNRRWVADITYIDTSSGFVYAAFIRKHSSLKERAGVKRVSACGFGCGARFAGRGWLARWLPFPRAGAVFVPSRGPVSGTGRSPAASRRRRRP